MRKNFGSICKIEIELAKRPAKRAAERSWANPMNMDTMRSFYNEVYYRNVLPSGTISRHYLRLAKRMNLSGEHRVLDVGCGTGQLARFLYDMGLGRYVGLGVCPRISRGPRLFGFWKCSPRSDGDLGAHRDPGASVDA